MTGVSKPDAPAIPEPKTVARAAGEELSAAEAAYAEASGQGESQDLALARDVAKYGYQVTLAKPAREVTTVEKVPGDFQVVHAELGTIQSTSGAGLEKAERNAQRGVRRSGPDVVRGVVATDQ